MSAGQSTADAEMVPPVMPSVCFGAPADASVGGLLQRAHLDPAIEGAAFGGAVVGDRLGHAVAARAQPLPPDAVAREPGVDGRGPALREVAVMGRGAGRIGVPDEVD